MSTPLISADNTWALMAITCGWAAFSIYAEQTWKWASKVSGAIVALIGALVLTNLGIIPTNCVWFDDIVWGYVVPMAIPMLLLSCDIRKIGREAGKILIIFMIGAIGYIRWCNLGLQGAGQPCEGSGRRSCYDDRFLHRRYCKLRCNGKCISGARRHNIRSGCSG